MEKLILSEDEISRICGRLASEIEPKLKEDDNGIPVFVGVRNGALPFLFELVRHLKGAYWLDTRKVSSYNGESSTGKVTLEKEPDHNLEGRDVVLVEDIIDTGTTRHFLKDFVRKKYKPKHLYVCVLVKRKNPKETYNELADFTGLTTDEQRYIVGFGFDYYGLFRNDPYVFVPSKDDRENWDKLLDGDKKKHPNQLRK